MYDKQSYPLSQTINGRNKFIIKIIQLFAIDIPCVSVVNKANIMTVYKYVNSDDLII